SRRETQSKFPRVPSLIPRSFATWAIGRDVSITIFTASSLNSGEKLFFGRGKFLPFQIVHPNGRTVRKPRGTSGRDGGLPGQAGGGCQGAGEPELVPGRDDQPGPAVGGRGAAQQRGGPAEVLLEEPEGVLDVEAAQVRLPEPGRPFRAGRRV